MKTKVFCPQCYSITYAIQSPFKSLVIAGLSIGFGVMYLLSYQEQKSVSDNASYLILSLAILLIFFGVKIIRKRQKPPATCPKCTFRNTKSLGSNEALAIIYTYNLSSEFDKSDLCTNCHYIGEGIPTQISTIFGAIFLLVLGIVYISLGVTSDSIRLYGGAIFLLFGLYCLYPHIRNRKICPKCSKKSVISVDSNLAQQIIQDHKLTISEPSKEESYPSVSQ